MLVHRRDPPGAGRCPAGAVGPGPPTVLTGAGERLSLGDEEPIQALMSTSATDSSGTSARRRPGPIPPTTSPGWSRLPNQPEAPSVGFSVSAPRTTSVFAGFRFPSRGDLGRGPLVPAIWPVLPGCRGAAGRARRHRRSRDRLPVVQRFTGEFIEAARPRRHVPGDRWFVDETYLKVGGKWAYLYRAVDQHGQVIDVLLSTRRDLAAARRFFTRALRAGTIQAEG